MPDRHELGVDDDETVLAELVVQYPRRFERSLDVHAPGRDPHAAAGSLAMGTLFGGTAGRRAVSGIGRYRAWQEHADAVGFPVGGMSMRLGVTERRLVVWSTTFVRSRPKRLVGDVPLRRVAQASASRAMTAGRLHLVLDDNALITLETLSARRARRFVDALRAARARLHT